MRAQPACRPWYQNWRCTILACRGTLPPGGAVMNHPGPPTIHYTELPPPGPNDPLELEWNTYRREVARLLAEGQEGRHVLIKGEEIVGIYDTRDHALEVAYQRFLDEPFFVHQIQTRERLY